MKTNCRKRSPAVFAGGKKFSAQEIDGVARVEEILDADPDGDGSTILKRHRRKITENDEAVYLRLEN